MRKKSLNVKKRNLNKSTFFLNQIFIKKIYKIFDRNVKGIDKALVAVSGGPDSLALAFLAKCYSIHNRIKFHYALVDHNLRKESSLESKTVAKLLKKIDINCKILVWRGKKPNSNIQKTARNKRYQLLFKECNRLKVNKLLLGHQINDLHENFFLRMTRGSGLKGLTSLGKNSVFSNMEILRPLINLKKKDLENLALKVFGTFMKDPSNKNEDFTRVRIRKILKEFNEEGLDFKKINLTINNLKSANEALDFYTRKNIVDNATYIKKKKSFHLNKNFFNNPNEVLLRSISSIFQILSGRYYAPRGRKLMRLISQMTLQNDLKKATLGGCIVEKVKETVIIYEE